MGKTPSSYTNSSKARSAAARETAANAKREFSQARFTIRFSRDSVTFEHTTKKG
ncbi:MAG: hypothetical protein IJV40_07250 [Oscillospiraceae bacterium]|nr:hypothetical protein [Oscillospiraceae bacterium]